MVATEIIVSNFHGVYNNLELLHPCENFRREEKLFPKKNHNSSITKINFLIAIHNCNYSASVCSFYCYQKHIYGIMLLFSRISGRFGDSA